MTIKNRKVIFSSLMILIITVLISGCFGGNPTDEVNEDILWDNYSNDYVEFKYPDEWKKANEKILDVNDNGTDDRMFVKWVDNIDEFKTMVRLELLLTEEEMEDIPNLDTKEDFYNYVENEINEMPPESNIVKQEKITVDNNPTYRIVVTDTDSYDEEVKSDYLIIFKNNLIQRFQYSTKGKDEYNSNLWKEIYESLELKF